MVFEKKEKKLNKKEICILKINYKTSRTNHAILVYMIFYFYFNLFYENKILWKNGNFPINFEGKRGGLN